MIKGVCIDFTNDPAKYAAPLKALGVTGVRGWMTQTNDKVDETQLAGARAWKNAGFVVAVTITRPQDSLDLPISAQVESLARSLSAKARGLFEYIQLGNEINLSKYWGFSMPQFLEKFIKPFLQGWGDNHYLASPSVTYNYAPLKCVAAFRALVDAGCVAPFNKVDIHPYAQTSEDAKIILNGIKANGATRIICTECNVAANQGPQVWMREIVELWNVMNAAGVEAAFHYRGIQKIDSVHGLMSPITASCARTGYYDTFKALG